MKTNVAFLLLIVVLYELLQVSDDISRMLHSIKYLLLSVIDIDNSLLVRLDEVRVELARRLNNFLAHFFWIVFCNDTVTWCTLLAVEALGL